MADYLFLFSIGPVQSFIAQARKTQDLYAGSQLLSALIDGTMKEAEDFLGNDCFTPIFPNKELESKPNRFFAKLHDVAEDEVEQFGGKLEKFVRWKFNEVAKESYKKARCKNKIPEEFTTQIERHLEVYWAARPVTMNYHDDYPKFEALFGATKNIRPFDSLPEIGKKCSLCGERNVLFCGSGKNEKETKEIKEKTKLKPALNRLSDEERRTLGFKIREMTDELRGNKRSHKGEEHDVQITQ